MKHFAIVLFALVLAACSEPRVGSDAALDASLPKVRSALAPAERAEFDLLVAQARAAADADAAPDGEAGAHPLASIQGMTAAGALATLRAEQAERVRAQAEAEEQRRAEQAARDAREFAALSAKAKANATGLERLRGIEIGDLRPKVRKVGQRRIAGIFAKVRNTLDVPLQRVGFDYAVRGKDGTPFASGTGLFAIEGGLPPGESREVAATSPDGDAGAFAAVVAMLQQHPDRVLAVTVDDAAGADGKSLLAPPLSAAEQRRLDSLRASTRASARR